jgi:hypothetical protein
MLPHSPISLTQVNARKAAASVHATPSCVQHVNMHLEKLLHTKHDTHWVTRRERGCQMADIEGNGHFLKEVEPNKVVSHACETHYYREKTIACLSKRCVTAHVQHRLYINIIQASVPKKAFFHAFAASPQGYTYKLGSTNSSSTGTNESKSQACFAAKRGYTCYSPTCQTEGQQVFIGHIHSLPKHHPIEE